MSQPVWYVGDQDPSISDTITVAGVPFDLTGLTVQFKMRPVGSSTLTVNAAATITTPTSGTVTYSWGSTDLTAAGFYLAWWEVEIAGKVQAVQETVIEVRAHAPTTGWLVELADVRQAMELSTTDTSLDASIIRLIPVASLACEKHARREFHQTGTATRTLRVNNHLVDLAIYDLQTITTITLDPNGTPVVLQPTDYRGLPTHKPYGVFEAVRLNDYLPRETGTWIQFGFNEVQIAGTWGFPSVPADVKEACIIALRSWLRRDLSTYAQVDAELRQLSPEAFGTYKLPPASKAMLDDYQRLTL